MMNANELADLTELKISNMTVSRLREIWDSMGYKTEAELVNAIRNYAEKSHKPDEVQSKSDRLLAAFMMMIYEYEQAKIMEDL
jgi:hypothetical protein